MAVLGVDACKDGWVATRLDGAVHVIWGATITDMIERAGPVDLVAIDIPIGLPTSAPRQADVLARRAVGRRGSSVFTTPPRIALEAASHPEASARSLDTCGYGISRQAYALGPKILEVDA